MTKKNLLLYGVLGLLFFYLLVLQVAAIWPFTIDDMYITLRYAKNWVDGAGLLWNPNSPPVEGYSNFLFVCIAALALKCGLNPVIVLKGLGVLGLLGTALGLYYLARFWFSKALALIPVLWLLIYRDEILWVSSGLETTVYQALLIFSVCALLRGLGYQFMPLPRGELRAKYWISAAVLLVFAGLTRPEGAALGALFLAIAYFNLPRNKQAKACFFSAFSVFALLYGSYFISRWHYYGLLLPNSVYCKGFSKAHSWVLDIAYLKLAWPFLLLGLFGGLSAKYSPGPVDRRHYFLWLPTLIYLIFLARADVVSAMAQRLFLPAFVLLLPLTLLGLQSLVNYFFSQTNKLNNSLISVMALWLALLCLPISSLQQLAYFTENPLSGDLLRMQVSNWLKSQHLSPRDHIILGDSGMIPYLISAHFEDSYCLNNKRMGKESYSTMFDSFCERTFMDKPAVIILAALVEQGETIYSPADQCLKRGLAKRADYQQNKIFQRVTNDSAYRYEIFTRKT